jgi:prepilin-type N-terminal cleavage/methylation domain-containing protein
MKKPTITHIDTKRRRNSGFSLIELLLAMIVLAVGLLGGMIVLLTAIASNAKSRYDTAAVAMAQSTMDRIIVLSASSDTQTTSVTDCTGTSHTMTTTGGDYPGPGAPLVDLSGLVNGTKVIDFTAAPVAGYRMLYTLCAQGASGNTGIPQTYDVRWNVVNTTTGNAGAQLVMVAAKNVTEIGNGLQGQTKYFSIPITLRGIRGN